MDVSFEKARRNETQIISSALILLVLNVLANLKMSFDVLGSNPNSDSTSERLERSFEKKSNGLYGI